MIRYFRHPCRTVQTVLAASLIAFGWGTVASADEQPLQIGYSFNEGSRAGSGPTDYYGVLNGAWHGNWSPEEGGGSAYFVSGQSGEEGDYAIVTAAGNRVRVDASDAFGHFWGPFTLEANITVGPTGAFRRLISMGTIEEGQGQNGEGFVTILQVNSLNQLRGSFGGGNVQTAFGLQQDRWYHVAFTYDPEVEEVSLYLDGNKIGSAPLGPWPEAHQTPRLFIGASHTGGSQWQGKIDDVRITQAVLDPEDFLVDGFGTELVQPPPPPEPLPDANELQLFWTELDLGQIETARADGSGRATLVTGLERPIGIQIDQENGYVYWSEDGVLGEANNGRIARANLDGSSVTTLYAGSLGHEGLGNPQHIAIDPAGGMIYWADFSTGIYRAPIDGSGPIQNVYWANWENFTNIALDLVNNHVYFGNPQHGNLWRTDLNGNNFHWGPYGLTSTWAFNGLAVDPNSGKMYFPDSTAIRSANFDGSSNVEIATGLSTPLGVTLGPDKERVFFAERGGQRIGVVHVDGSHQQPVLVGLDNPFSVAVIRVEAVAEPFQQWRADRFTPEELENEDISGPAATPAGDGIPNLLKFALGLEPKTPSRELLPQAVMENGSLQLTYTHANEASDVEIVVEVSTDLVTWQAGSEHLDISETTGEPAATLTATVGSAYQDEDRVFLRLRAAFAE